MLLDPPPESTHKSNAMKYAAVFIALTVVIAGWFLFRYYPEKRAVGHFFDALVAGNTEQAYQLWKPSGSYRKGDFLADWGPEGYYGPVKSYEIMRATRLKSSNGIIVSVAVSPFSPMPGENDPVKSRRTKVIPLFVDVDSKAMSFSPSSPDEQ
ncbi:MAG TPA: hypothetical protein VFP96_06640 [Candidatus Acidoferrum sp.]|jgi:hypothetical protein|nr:hypothetical protein [Candidatus Acidoferrum sp.]